MRNSILLSSVAIAALTLAACSNPDSRSADSSATPSETAASSAAASESASMTGAMSDHAHMDHGSMHGSMSGSMEAPSATTTVAAAAAGLSFTEGVVRAMGKDADMTAIFGLLHNESDKDITVVGFTSSIRASMNQIHEVTDGVMQEKTDGLTIPAGGTAQLAPGADHFMLMGVSEPVMAGDTVELTVILSDGTAVELGEVPVRSMGAGAEGYSDLEGGSEAADASDMPGMTGTSDMHHMGATDTAK